MAMTGDECPRLENLSLVVEARDEPRGVSFWRMQSDAVTAMASDESLYLENHEEVVLIRKTRLASAEARG